MRTPPKLDFKRKEEVRHGSGDTTIRAWRAAQNARTTQARGWLKTEFPTQDPQRSVKSHEQTQASDCPKSHEQTQPPSRPQPRLASFRNSTNPTQSSAPDCPKSHEQTQPPSRPTTRLASFRNSIHPTQRP